jgi:hypothetical protein
MTHIIIAAKGGMPYILHVGNDGDEAARIFVEEVIKGEYDLFRMEEWENGEKVKRTSAFSPRLPKEEDRG